MRYIEVTVDTPAEEIDRRCEEMSAMGVGGFVIENEADFQAFLENNHQYWDYVDDELEQKFAGVSRIKCYLTDDGEGKKTLRAIRAAKAAGNIRVLALGGAFAGMGDFAFPEPLEIGDRVVFDDMIHYTMVKTTFFNGVKHPAIGMVDKEQNFFLLREPGYEAYKEKLG